MATPKDDSRSRSRSLGSRSLGSPSSRFAASLSSSSSHKSSYSKSSKLFCPKLKTGDEHYAASAGHVHWLQACMQKAESPTQADINGFSALHTAALHGRLDCIKILIEKFKIDIDLSSVTGWRPIHLVMSRESGDKAVECLRYLIEKGADVNVQNQFGVSPLHKAASEGHGKCIPVLVDAGADVHAKDLEGHEPIDVCRMWGNRACAKCLSSAMWKVDKASFAREVCRLNKIKADCKRREKEFLQKTQMELDFCNNLAFEQWLEKKHLPLPSARILGVLANRRQMSVTLQKHAGEIVSLASSPSTLAREEIFDFGISERERRQGPWNVSTKPSSVPVSCIVRPTTIRLGVDPEETRVHDFTSFLFLRKNALGEAVIQIDGMGTVSSVPELPFDVIAKSLFPWTWASRLEVPKDLRPLHLFDLKHRRPPNPEHKWTDQMAMSLRQTLDPAFVGALKAHVSTYSDPNLLSPRLESDRARGKGTASTQSEDSRSQC